jgi:predicted nucleic acid-binding protein
VLQGLATALVTTIPVLTEVFHLLPPASQGSERLRDFVAGSGCGVHYLDDSGLERAFALMQQYRDHPMDLADASLIVAAERLGTRRVFTLDRNDFETYRVKKGHRTQRLKIVA